MKNKLKKLISGKAGKIVLVIAGLLILFFTTAANERNKAIETIIAGIKADAGWLASIKSKADANSISLDQQLRLDASWVLQDDTDYKGKWWNF